MKVKKDDDLLVKDYKEIMEDINPNGNIDHLSKLSLFFHRFCYLVFYETGKTDNEESLAFQVEQMRDYSNNPFPSLEYKVQNDIIITAPFLKNTETDQAKSTKLILGFAGFMNFVNEESIKLVEILYRDSLDAVTNHLDGVTNHNKVVGSLLVTYYTEILNRKVYTETQKIHSSKKISAEIEYLGSYTNIIKEIPSDIKKRVGKMCTQFFE